MGTQIGEKPYKYDLCNESNVVLFQVLDFKQNIGETHYECKTPFILKSKVL